MIARAIQVCFILLLLTSALGKVLDPEGFASIVATYQLLPDGLVFVAAWAVILTEFLLALWLAMGLWPQYRHTLSLASIAVLGLHWLYFDWMLIALMRGLTIPNCGCFGVYLARPLTWFTPLEDAFLIFLAWLMWRAARSSKPLEQVLQ
jgi:Methylamine utilisation protein MauE